MTKSTGKTYKPGAYNFECNICRAFFKNDELRTRWDGVVTCNKCWDPKPWFLLPQPQVVDLVPVGNSSPATPATYIQNNLNWEDQWVTWDAATDNWEDM